MPSNPQLQSVTIFNATMAGDFSAVSAMLSANPSLVRSRDEDERTALHWASSNGKSDLVTLLLERGAEVDAVDDAGWTSLMIATSSGHTDCVELVVRAGGESDVLKEHAHYVASKNRLDIARILLNPPTDQKKANVNATDSSGQTPLHRAASRGYDKMVEILLDNGAASDKEDKQGNTALHLACEEGHGSTAVLLIGRGCSLDWKNKDEKTPLELADRAVKTFVQRSVV
ncbi:26S proteasome non-ATPase regulatory subunit 10-like protein [Gonapodya prolifera JEL478]|uniref:26S proteasome non-ATPase regulatory subunit 10-like protein n=1 Tax=Gonapodya prolifera (strain JEL478) TaxID=1344416 RepID=A0A139B0G2_GONPJ|nr:26S proteasome non-ATPase regulatory subunit 10-like protein [Gonapodya prolifera JEL478]|eukprot:KXS22457.1 26S proteasome non-ATPase regulatory subunit 10-like protein [Gonapodya prolifera JEL478]